MNIDFGWMGKVVMCRWEPEDHFIPKGEEFMIISDGYTESGIRIHGVFDNREYASYPCIWRNSILIKFD